MVEETRPAATGDTDPAISAASDERFRNKASASAVSGTAPEGWTALPAKQFRDLNYKFGRSGEGEAYVTLAMGSVKDNVNRWFRQFGRDPLSPAEMEGLETIRLAGTEGVLVEATGTYEPGMGGAPAKPGYGLAGVIADVGGKIVTVKMVGPEDEVSAERENLKKFARSLVLGR